MARILSGIKPTGQMTLGNYIGALKNFPKFQDRGETFIFVADLHALTLPIDPEELRTNTRNIVAFYLAAGLDPQKCTIFRQSQVSQHAELMAILQNYLYLGELSRMTQFKEKVQDQNQNAIGLGLFTYPVLMAADILLYDANIVPVGEDQTQHVEITRDLARRFNNRYGEILVMPKAEVSKVGKRIMSLSNPLAKMSKSEPKGDIFLLDTPSAMKKKIMAAVTDSGNEVIHDVQNKPGISNLLQIYCALKEISISAAEKEFKDFRYGDFKKVVAQTVIDELIPFQERYQKIINSNLIEETLKQGEERARAIAEQVLKRVQKAVGLL
ncbi:MAG: tryptophan--tRNA ligase [Bacilli bacterium]